ncbi:MAG: DUF2180 family protein [Clostridiales bacterium]|jgi:hypothetical protein|nr:DUF2180 family protein [Clostridiales bacterium]
MRCFIHYDREAVAVCLLCGKAMCMNCSCLDGHSGRCPACRVKDTTEKLNAAKQARRKKAGVLVAHTLLFLVFGAIAGVLSLATVFEPPLVPLPFLSALLEWQLWLRALVAGLPGLAALVFFIVMWVYAAKTVGLSKTVRTLQNEMTQINMQINEPSVK